MNEYVTVDTDDDHGRLVRQIVALRPDCTRFVKPANGGQALTLMTETEVFKAPRAGSEGEEWYGSELVVHRDAGYSAEALLAEAEIQSQLYAAGLPVAQVTDIRYDPPLVTMQRVQSGSNIWRGTLSDDAVGVLVRDFARFCRDLRSTSLSGTFNAVAEVSGFEHCLNVKDYAQALESGNEMLSAALARHDMLQPVKDFLGKLRARQPVLLHNDLCQQNVFIRDDGHIECVIDFGRAVMTTFYEHDALCFAHSLDRGDDRASEAAVLDLSVEFMRACPDTAAGDMAAAMCIMDVSPWLIENVAPRANAAIADCAAYHKQLRQRAVAAGLEL